MLVSLARAGLHDFHGEKMQAVKSALQIIE